MGRPNTPEYGRIQIVGERLSTKPKATTRRRGQRYAERNQQLIPKETHPPSFPMVSAQGRPA